MLEVDSVDRVLVHSQIGKGSEYKTCIRRISLISLMISLISDKLFTPTRLQESYGDTGPRSVAAISAAVGGLSGPVDVLREDARRKALRTSEIQKRFERMIRIDFYTQISN